MTISPYGELRRAVQALADGITQDVESRRRVIRTLVEQLGHDLRVLEAQLKERGPDHILPVWLAGHVRELVEAQADLDTKRRELDTITKVLEGDE
ncbi:MAG: hypothetical protein IPJ77_07315 [Planctomycetes bacterium]|nr:hypothetical protein [Planctomycetota bacterium]